MNDSNIPLLTDVVDAEQDEAEPEPEPASVDAIDELEDIVVFEADDPVLGDTNKHFVPDAEAWEHDSRENVDSVEIADFENVVAELQTRIASHTYELTDELLRAAFADIEAKIFRQISTHLRQQLPELIDSVVREHLLERKNNSED